MRSVNMEKPRPLKWRTVITTGVAALAVSTAFAFSRPTAVIIDGQRILSDVPPVTQNHEAYLPLRAVIAGLGAETTYDKASRTIDVIRGTDRLHLHVGDHNAILNGKPVRLLHAPFTVRGRTMVATRTIERALGPKVRYNPQKAQIDVFTTDSSVAADSSDSDPSNSF